MAIFTSARERRFWLWTLVVVVAIWSTLGFAPTVVEELRDPNVFDAVVFFGFLLIGVAILAIGIRVRPGGAEIGVALGIAAVYLMLVGRIGISAERSHLFEYGVVALFVHEALKERAKAGRLAAAPAVLAIAMTAILGLLDESIQAILPNRVWDIVDVGFNALAAFMAVTASVALSWTRTRFSRRSGKEE